MQPRGAPILIRLATLALLGSTTLAAATCTQEIGAAKASVLVKASS